MTDAARLPEVTVLYSGGTDSTLAAALLAERFERVTLLTFQPGYLLFIENTRVLANALVDAFGAERVRHEIIPIERFIDAILFSRKGEDWRAYGPSMASLVCLGCRLSMHTMALIWNLERGVPFLADGSIRKQADIPEQMESTLAANSEFYLREFGVRRLSPIYDETRSDEKLVELGITNRVALKRQFILFDTQATCPFGVPADVYARLFYGLMGDQRERDSERYRDERYPMMIEQARGYFAAKGLDYKALADENRRRLEEWGFDGAD